MGAVLAAASFVAVAGMSLRVASVPPVLDLDHIQHNGGIADIRQVSVTNAAKIKRHNDFLRRFFFVRRACLLASLQKSGVVFYEIDRIACRSKNGRTEICPALPIIERTRLSDHAYGIYFFHYVFVLWLQYMLLDLLLIAPLKAAIVIAGALLLSWAASTMTGQIVLPRRVSNPRPRSASLG
jgi:hypothetical protein